MRVPRRTSDLFAFLFDSRSAPVLFIAAALLMAAMGNAFYDLVTDVIGSKSRGSLALIIASGLVLIVIVVLGLKGLAEIFFRRQPPRIGGSQAFSVRRRAIIFSVGKQSDTIALCLHHQHPEFVGFVCTADSERFAEDLIVSNGLNSNNCLKKVVDPWDISEVRDMTRDLLAKLIERSIAPAEIVFDITGGLTSMSLGVFMAAEESQIDSQYIRSEYDEEGKRLSNTEEAVFIRRFTSPVDDPERMTADPVR